MSGGAGKRLLDVVLGTLFALVTLPVVLLLSVAVCVSLRTWHPFFFQQRIGRGGKSFTLVKLRTLPHHAPPAADKYTIAAVKTTRLGRFLRATHLDELPQLWLVPSGRMSLVGPRPEMPGLLATFDPSFVAARSNLRPGCTGLWQISIHARNLIGEAPEYDLYYLEHAGIRLDAWVLWKSFLVVAGGQPVSYDDVQLWVQRRSGVVRSEVPELAAELSQSTMSASG